jgi:hypothetical protein
MFTRGTRCTVAQQGFNDREASIEGCLQLAFGRAVRHLAHTNLVRPSERILGVICSRADVARASGGLDDLRARARGNETEWVIAVAAVASAVVGLRAIANLLAQLVLGRFVAGVANCYLRGAFRTDALGASIGRRVGRRGRAGLAREYRGLRRGQCAAGRRILRGSGCVHHRRRHPCILARVEAVRWRRRASEPRLEPMRHASEIAGSRQG